MSNKSTIRRAAFGAVLFSPLVVGLLVASCTDDSSNGPPDAGCGAIGCTDATVDHALPPGQDGATDSTADAAPEASPADAGADREPIDAAMDQGADQEATDAGIDQAVADADPYADADPNCANYVVSAGGSPARVTIHNARDAGIYLGKTTPSCALDIGFTFNDQADASQTLIASEANSCALLQGELMCNASCASSLVTKIAPDASYDIGWPGTVFVPKWMPPSCYYDAGCVNGPCLQEVKAPDGTVYVTAYTSYSCDGGPCPYDCTTGVSGSCLVQFANAIGGTALPGSAAYTSGASRVTITIQ